MDAHTIALQPAQRLIDFDLDPKLRWIAALSAPKPIRKLLTCLAIFGCAHPAAVTTDGESDGGEWLLDPSIADLARAGCCSESTVKNWLRFLRAHADPDYLQCDTSDRTRHAFWIDWNRLSSAQSEIDPGQFRTEGGAVYENDPGQFTNLTPVNSGTDRGQIRNSSASRPYYEVKLKSLSDSVTQPGVDSLDLTPPGEAWLPDLDQKTLRRHLAPWLKSLPAHCDPADVAGAILAARECADGDPVAYMRRCLQSGLRPHWRARGEQLAADPAAPIGKPRWLADLEAAQDAEHDAKYEANQREFGHLLDSLPRAALLDLIPSCYRQQIADRWPDGQPIPNAVRGVCLAYLCRRQSAQRPAVRVDS